MELSEKEIQGQTSLVRTQARIVAEELHRRLNRPAFVDGADDAAHVIQGLQRFCQNLEDLHYMRIAGGAQ